MPPFAGTAGDDILYGSEDPDLVEGFGGNDRLFGLSGDDTLDGGDGSDILYGGPGADWMMGRLGDDFYEVDNPGDDVFEEVDSGNDLVFTAIDYTLPANIERLAALHPSSTNTLTLIGNALANEIIGNAGANLLIGGGGADILRGDAGNDTYVVQSDDYVGESAGGGYDVIYFDGATSDAMHNTFDYSLRQRTGQQQNHVEELRVYIPTTTNSVNLEGWTSADILAGNDGINVLDGLSGADTMIGYGGDDLYVVDDAGDLVIEAADGGYDTVFANGTLDYVLGDDVERLVSFHGPGNTLTGNALDNEITHVGDASNTIDGKEGRDILTGGGGDDFFAFTTALGDDNVDQLVGYEAQRDKMLLDDAVFVGLTPGALAESAFRISNQVHTAEDRIIYDSSTGKLYFDADGIGSQNGMQLFAVVHEGTPLTGAGDFLVI